MTSPQRTALRYHGGKWKLAPWIISHLPPHRVYVEPYGGAASVLLRKPRSYAEVYNDLDGEIVNVFRVLRDHAMSAELQHRITFTAYSRDEFTKAYEPAPVGDAVERARRTIVRSFMGFGSNSIQAEQGFTGFRANALRQGTVPAADWTNWPAQVPLFCERLRGVCIENRDAIEIIDQQDSPGTLFYVDPPYPHSTRSGGNPYDKKHLYRHELTDDGHRRMAEVLHHVEGMVVVSGYPCELYDLEIFRGWHRVDREALADGARRRTEVLWFNPAAEAAIPRQQLLEVSP